MDVMEKIKAEMERQDVSVYKMSRKLGISEQAIYKWMRGKGDPTMAHLEDMAWVLGYELTIRRVKDESGRNVGIEKSHYYEQYVG